MTSKEGLIYIAALVENCAQVSEGFVELRMRPDIPKVIHQLFGGGYYEVGKGEKCRGRVRLYGDAAVEFLKLIQPHFRTSRGERIRKLLRKIEAAA